MSVTIFHIFMGTIFGGHFREPLVEAISVDICVETTPFFEIIVGDNALRSFSETVCETIVGTIF